MNTILNQPYRRRASTYRPNRKDSQLAASFEGESGPAPAEKTLPHSYPKTRFRRESKCIEYMIGGCEQVRIATVAGQGRIARLCAF